MNKRKNAADKKRLLGITLEPERIETLKALAKYVGLSVSELVRKLLPTILAIDSFKSYQQYSNMPPRHILKLLNKSNAAFLGKIMEQHIICPIYMQVRATAYFDKDGSEVFNLFNKFIKALNNKKALNSKKGYRFQTVELAKFRKGAKSCKSCFCLAPKDTIKEIGRLVTRYIVEAEVSVLDIKASYQQHQASDELRAELKGMFVNEMEKLLKEAKRQQRKVCTTKKSSRK